MNNNELIIAINDFKIDKNLAIQNYGNISEWDVSGVTNMNGLFKNMKSFNEDISNWNVSKVTDMSDMFYGCNNFNIDISSWNVNKVTNMKSMFFFCSSFNQNLNSWNTSNVTNMNTMFTGCESFVQSLNLWDITNVTNKNYMFYNATNQLLYFKNQFDSKGTPKQWPLILSNTIKGIFYDTSLNKLIISKDVLFEKEIYNVVNGNNNEFINPITRTINANVKADKTNLYNSPTLISSNSDIVDFTSANAKKTATETRLTMSAGTQVNNLVYRKDKSTNLVVSEETTTTFASYNSKVKLNNSTDNSNSSSLLSRNARTTTVDVSAVENGILLDANNTIEVGTGVSQIDDDTGIIFNTITIGDTDTIGLYLTFNDDINSAIQFIYDNIVTIKQYLYNDLLVMDNSAQFLLEYDSHDSNLYSNYMLDLYEFVDIISWNEIIMDKLIFFGENGYSIGSANKPFSFSSNMDDLYSASISHFKTIDFSSIWSQNYVDYNSWFDDVLSPLYIDNTATITINDILIQCIDISLSDG